MFYFDPFYLLFALPALLFSMWASWRVKSNFSHYSQVGTANGYSGAEAAAVLLHRAGIDDVDISQTDGFLSDHYDPTNKRLALSPDVYHGRSVASIGVAAHEAGHAIQHKEKYAALGLRSALVPLATIGSSLGYIVMAVGLFLSPFVTIAGVAIFSTVLLFQLVTLPVEFDATRRAKALVVEAGIVTVEERHGMDKVLNAAALTYVGAVFSSLMVILYYLWRSGLLGGRSDE
jgi:hypothetical protein